MGIVPRSRNPSMESLSQFLVGRLALYPLASTSKLLHARQSPSTRNFFPPLCAGWKAPLWQLVSSRVWPFSQYLPQIHSVFPAPQKLDSYQLLTASRSRIQQAIRFNSDYFIQFFATSWTWRYLSFFHYFLRVNFFNICFFIFYLPWLDIWSGMRWASKHVFAISFSQSCILFLFLT